MNRFNTKGKRTYNISEIIVGDIVKFKGTRNGGLREVIRINEKLEWYPDKIIVIDSYFSQVLELIRGHIARVPYTSTNSVDKLSHVFRDGTWFKVIKD